MYFAKVTEKWQQRIQQSTSHDPFAPCLTNTRPNIEKQNYANLQMALA